MVGSCGNDHCKAISPHMGQVPTYQPFQSWLSFHIWKVLLPKNWSFGWKTSSHISSDKWISNSNNFLQLRHMAYLYTLGGVWYQRERESYLIFLAYKICHIPKCRKAAANQTPGMTCEALGIRHEVVVHWLQKLKIVEVPIASKPCPACYLWGL